MMRWIPVRASRLHKRRLVCGDLTIRQATLFPFFDGSGAVEQVLVIDADSSELRTFPLDATRTSIRFWGPIRVDGRISRLDQDVLERLAPLWHFDPWWLLRDQRFASHPETPLLKTTNCAGSFHDPPVDLFFSRRLTYVGGMIVRSSEQGFESKRFRSEILPLREPLRLPATETPRGGWQLNPFWQ